jgi:sarcosine oxidase gamma subunit
VAATGPLQLADLTPLSKVLIRAEGGAVPVVVDCPFGRVRRTDDGCLVVGSGPGEWLVLAPAGHQSALAEAVLDRLPEAALDRLAEAVLDRPAGTDANDPGEALVSVVDVTHGGCVFRLTGAESHRILEKICAIDLGEAVTPDGSCFRSSVARVICDVVRDDVDGARSYLLHGDRSSGQYLFDTLLDAGAELSVEVGPYPDKEI